MAQEFVARKGLLVPSGNVGIGTTTPSAKLQVVGGSTTTSISDAATTLNSRFDLANPAISLGIGYVSSDIPMLQSVNNGTNAATNLTINPFGGNVGIGTASPAAKLHVLGSSRMTSTGGIATPLLSLLQDNNANGYYFSIDNALDGRMELRNDAGTSIQTWQRSSGNVGIGTTSPTQKLSIGGVGSAISFDTTGASGTSLIQTVLDFELSIKNNRGTSSEIRVGNEVLNFFTNSSERMRITSIGNVLIGTTSGDGYKLQIVGNSQASSTFGITYSTVAAYSQWINSSGAFVMGLDASAGATERIRITSAGNVCIGNTNNTYKLDVTGIIYATSFYAGANSNSPFTNSGWLRADPSCGLFIVNSTASSWVGLKSDGTVSASSLGTGTVYSNGGVLTNTNPSDINLKKNILPLNYGLQDILKLNPVTYEWKDGSNGKQFGFIAQEVEYIMPDAVKHGDYLGLEKDAIYSALVNAIKELKTEIETLKNK